MKKGLLVLLTAVLLVPVFIGCGGGGEGVEFSLVNGGEPESLDPHLISGVPEHRIYESIFEGLLAYDAETAEGVPGVAESWEVSEDGKTYTFHLRKTTWSDGVPITAETVVKSWQRMLNPETGAPYAWFPAMFLKNAGAVNSGDAPLEDLGVKAIDDYTLEVQLAGPLPYVTGALPHYSFGIVPIHAIEEHGDQWTLPENFVGNGPFVLEDWKPQEELTVVPNDKYWDAEAVQLDRVRFIPLEDNNTGYNMFLNGEVDWMTEVPTDVIDEAKLREDYNANPQLATYYYVINNGREPFDDAKVRKALTMAVDRVSLVEQVTKAGQIPANSIVPPMTGYEAIEGNRYDVAAAQELLAEAGFEGGEGFPEFEILYNTSDNHKKIAEYMQQQWEENLGISCSLVNQEWKTYLATRRNHDFDVARAGWVGDYQDPNTFLDMFVTGGAMNGGQYSNEEYDALIDKAATMDPGPARFETLRKAEKTFITEDQGILPLYWYVTQNMIDTDKWGGWHTNVMDYHPVKDIYLKK